MRSLIYVRGEAVGPAVDGQITELSPGIYAVAQNGKVHEVYVASGEIWVDGHAMDFRREDPREWKGEGGAVGAKGRAAITAPMPGKVIRLLVEVGQPVEAGDGILVMEAMKMQNELKAPRAGVVSSVEVKPNDGVTAGMVLAVIG